MQCFTISAFKGQNKNLIYEYKNRNCHEKIFITLSFSIVSGLLD